LGLLDEIPVEFAVDECPVDEGDPSLRIRYVQRFAEAIRAALEDGGCVERLAFLLEMWANRPPPDEEEVESADGWSYPGTLPADPGLSSGSDSSESLPKDQAQRGPGVHEAVSPRASEGDGRYEVEAVSGWGQPGYLGLILVQDRFEVRRVGVDEVLDFAGQRLRWALLERLYRSRGVFCHRSELRLVWENIGLAANPEDGTINAAISDLRKALEPLSLTIDCRRGTGWRLEVLPRPDQP
jgi:hypothetical protein